MTDKANVIYKDIPGFEGFYKISNCGDVISCSRQIPTGSGDKRRFITLKEKMLNPVDNKGYKYVHLRKDNKTKTVGVHQLVLWAFVGVQKVGIETRHLNSNPSDNRFKNLAYGTKSDNMKDAVKFGTLVFSRSKLTIADVNNIAKSNGTLQEIAKIFNCNTGTVQGIKTGKYFKDFIKEINYKERTTKKLSFDILEFIRDKNNNYIQIQEKFGFTFNQIKRIRKGQDHIYC